MIDLMRDHWIITSCLIYVVFCLVCGIAGAMDNSGNCVSCGENFRQDAKFCGCCGAKA